MREDEEKLEKTQSNAPTPQQSQENNHQRQAPPQPPSFSLMHALMIAFLMWSWFFSDSKGSEKASKESMKPLLIKQEHNVFNDAKFTVEVPVEKKVVDDFDEFGVERSQIPTAGKTGLFGGSAVVVDKTEFNANIPNKERIKVLITFDENSEYITNAAVALKKFLETNYPQTAGNVIGHYAPLPSWVVLFNAVSGLLQMGGLLFMFAGKKMLGENHFLVKIILANKWRCALVIAVLNLVGASFQWTGEFDIEVNGELFFSKVQEERFPTGQEVVNFLHQKGIDPVLNHLQKNLASSLKV